MKKVIIFALILHSVIFANGIKQSWTIVLYNTNSISNANYFIQENIFNNNEKLFIIKVPRRYLATYGSYETRNDAIVAYRNLPTHLQKIGAYTTKTEYDLLYPQNSTNVMPITVNKGVKKPEKEMTIQKRAPFHPQKIKKIAKRKNTKSISFHYNVILGLEYAFLKQSGDFKIGTNGSKTNFKDLNVDSSNAITPSIDIAIGAHKILFSYFTNSVKENATLADSIIADTYTYNSNQKINSSFKTNLLQMGYRYNFDSLSIGTDIYHYTNDIKLSNNENTTQIKLDYLFPTIALDMKHKINDYSINYGVSYGLNSDIKYTNLYGSFVIPFSFIDLSLGYELNQFKTDETLYNSDTKYQGFTLKLMKTF